MNRLSRLFLLAGLPALALSLVSCATSPDAGGVATITKVNPYHLQPGKRIETEDNMIAFEQRHYYHGAIDATDFMEKFGHYFSIFWKNDAKGADYTVKLEYTQANTGPEIHVKEVQVPGAGSRNTTKIDVIGEEYQTNGPVTSFKVSLISGGQTVAENRSFLWK